MSQAVTDYCYILAQLQQHGGVSMSEVMKSNVWQAGSHQQFLVFTVQITVVSRRANSGRENQVIFVPCVTCIQYFLALNPVMFFQAVDHRMTQHDYSATSSAFGLAEHESSKKACAFEKKL